MPKHTIASIFKDETIRYSLSLFTKKDLDAGEASLFDKNRKPYLTCAAEEGM